MTATTRIFLSVAVGLLSSISGVTESQGEGRAIAYSSWQNSMNDAPERLGSFRVGRPESEKFIGGLFDEWREVILPELGEVVPSLRQQVREAVVFSKRSTDFNAYLRERREDLLLRLNRASADYLTGSLTERAEAGAGRYSFVRTVEWDYQSSLGKRRWQTGLNVMGALRETATDAVVWQLRGYAAKKSSGGANVGLIYRRGVGEKVLAGGNVFLDYEDHDYGSFSRWSLGGELRGGWGGLHFNRYAVLSGERKSTDGTSYSRDGFDVAAEFGIPTIRWVSGGLTYYRFDGEHGDTDEKGFRYHGNFDFAELLGGGDFWGGLSFDLEYDNGDGDWGGALAYRYRFDSAKPAGGATATTVAFSPRAHFFDPVRREYAQRISRVKDGGGGEMDKENWHGGFSVTATVVGGTAGRATLEFEADGETVALTTGGADFIYQNMAVLTARAVARSTLRAASSRWTVWLYAQSTMNFLEKGRRLHLQWGTLYIRHRSAIREITTPTMTIRLQEGVEVSMTVIYPTPVVSVRSFGETIRVRFGHMGTVGTLSTAPSGLSVYAVTAPASGYAFVNGTLSVVAPHSITVASTLAVRASDGSGRAAKGTVVLSPYSPLTAEPLPVATVSSSAPPGRSLATLTVRGGMAPYTYTVAGGGGAVASDEVIVLVSSGVGGEVRVVTAVVKDEISSDDLSLALTVEFIAERTVTVSVATTITVTPPAATITVTPPATTITVSTVTPTVTTVTPSVTVTTTAPPLAVRPAPVQYVAVTIRTPLRLLSLVASGGAPPYRWVATADAGGVLAVGTDGGVEVTALLAAGRRATVTVAATDGENRSGTGAVTVAFYRPLSDSVLTLTLSAAYTGVLLTATVADGTGRFAYALGANPASLTAAVDDAGVVELLSPLGGLAGGTLTVDIADRLGGETAILLLVLERVVDPLWISPTAAEYAVSPDYAGGVHTMSASGGFGDYRYEKVSGTTALAVDAETGGISLATALAVAGVRTTAVFVARDEAGGSVRFSLVVEAVAASVGYRDGGTYLIGGLPDRYSAGDDVWHRTESRTWTRVADDVFPPRLDHQAVSHGGTLWVIGGRAYVGAFERLSDIWYSVDGRSWTLATATAAFGDRVDHQVVSWRGSLWLVGGNSSLNQNIYEPRQKHRYNNDVWRSADGVNWTLVTRSALFLPRHGHRLVVHRGSLFVVGGEVFDTSKFRGNNHREALTVRSEIWRSGDGKAWWPAAPFAQAPFVPRLLHAAVSHGGSLWVVGGQTTGNRGLANDIWRSADGWRWTRVEAKLPVNGPGNQMVSHRGSLWFMGSGTNDWRSADGVNWTRGAPLPRILNRKYHQVVRHWIPISKEPFIRKVSETRSPLP